MEKKITKILYACRWAKNRETSWSGTSYSLMSALQKYVDVQDMDMTLNKLEKVIVKLTNIGYKNSRVVWSKPPFCNKYMSMILKKKYLKKAKFQNKGERVLQIGCFGNTNIPYYTYQDLSTTKLLAMMRDQDPSFRFSTYEDISLRDVARSAAEQMQVYQKADGIFTMGKWLADFLVNEVGIPAGKVHAVGGGTNIDSTKVDFSQKKGNKILFVGRDFKRKGGDLVCKAFNILQTKFMPNAELYIAGPANEPAECAINNNIKYIGALSYSELVNYFNACDVFCMPSRFEAYGLVFVEALIYGLPCIGRNSYEMKHFIQHGENGLLIEMDDDELLAKFMYRALTDTVMTEHVRSKHECYVEMYSWDSVAKRIINIMNNDALKS